MWPFKKKEQIKERANEYRHWLRGKFTQRRGRFLAIAAVSAVLVCGLVYTAVAVNFYDIPGRQVQEYSSTYELEDKPVNQFPQEDGEADSGARESSENTTESNYWAEEAPVTGSTGETGKQEDAAEEVTPEEQPAAVPVQGTKISGYGFHYSEEYEDYRFHEGVTYRAGENNSVRPCLPGRVTEVTALQNGGYEVKVEHGGDLASTYRGLSSVTASEGDELSAREVLGRAGEKVEFTLLKGDEPVNPSQYF